jgi:glycosyltransferase involved in cell wall biosynthesis
VRVLFLGMAYAGHRTRFLNLRAHTEHDPRLIASYRQVTGWEEGGAIESLPLLPRGFKGRIRAVSQSAPLAGLPRPDVIWTSASESLTPLLWAQAGPLRRPMILDMDCTGEQLEAFAPEYYQRPPKQGLRRLVANVMERALWSRVSLFMPWSRWAADGLRRAGIAPERIRVAPPGVDLEMWQPRPELRTAADGKLRLLFVGGDFTRKGGDMLVDVFSRRFAERCELHIVTRDPVTERPGVFVHRAEANSPLLKELYARADLFVLPTRAECFGIATVEAMASGLPTIMGNVGGAADIIDEAETGWLIEPTSEALAQALDHATADRALLRAMGLKARSTAEARFDGRKNDAQIVDMILEAAARFRHV